MTTPSSRVSRRTRRLLARAVARTVPSSEDEAEPRVGDELVPTPDVVMDRAFSISSAPAEVWPWLVQLGKGRAGWYLPRRVERLVPRGRRALRRIDSQWQRLAVGDVVPDYGGAEATFTVEQLDPHRHLVFSSRRGRMRISWSIVLRAEGASSTRVLLRLRLAPVRRTRLAESLGEVVDALTIAGLAAGLRERVASAPQNA